MKYKCVRCKKVLPNITKNDVKSLKKGWNFYCTTCNFILDSLEIIQQKIVKKMRENDKEIKQYQKWINNSVDKNGQIIDEYSYHTSMCIRDEKAGENNGLNWALIWIEKQIFDKEEKNVRNSNKK
jgi:hypothetical protein